MTAQVSYAESGHVSPLWASCFVSVSDARSSQQRVRSGNSATSAHPFVCVINLVLTISSSSVQTSQQGS